MTGLLVRQALPSDKPAVISLTREVWNGNDYVPFVWDSWLAEANGTTLVAAEGGEVVGVQHVALHPDGSAWLEGVRVGPARQGRGIGAALLESGLDWARRSGCPVARLSVSSSNPASNRITERAGMSVVETFYPLEPRQVDTPESMTVCVASPADAGRIWDFLAGWREDVGEAQFYTEGWTAYRLTAERLWLLLATHAVIWAGEQDLEAVAVVTCSPTRPRLRVGLITGSARGVTALTQGLRSRADEVKLAAVRGPVALKGGVSDALRAGGLQPVSDHQMLLRELAL